MSIVTVLIALVLAFLAWKLVTGVIKFGLIAVIIVAAIWLLTQGGLG